MWYWVLLVFCAYDQVFSIMSSPLFFYPILMIGIGIFAAFQMGMGPMLINMVLPIVSGKINQGCAAVGLPKMM
jgi:hypothetical protein